MFSKDIRPGADDREAMKILQDFLPDRIFDAHAHMLDTQLLPGLSARFDNLVCDPEKYQMEMAQLLGNPRQLRLNMIPYPDRSMAEKGSGVLQDSDGFIRTQLETFPQHVAEIMVRKKTC